MTDITPILEAIILVIIAPLMPIVAFYLRRWINTNISAQNQVTIEMAVRAGVLAAEQLGLSGQAAKARAVAIAGHYLAQYNISVDLEYIADLIEAEVMAQFNKPKISAL